MPKSGVRKSAKVKKTVKLNNGIMQGWWSDIKIRCTGHLLQVFLPLFSSSNWLWIVYSSKKVKKHLNEMCATQELLKRYQNENTIEPCELGQKLRFSVLWRLWFFFTLFFFSFSDGRARHVVHNRCSKEATCTVLLFKHLFKQMSTILDMILWQCLVSKNLFKVIGDFR